MYTAASVADRVALLSFAAINMCFMAFMKTITLLAEEKPVVQREQTARQYTSLVGCYSTIYRKRWGPKVEAVYCQNNR